MIAKVKDYFKTSRVLSSYADSEIECIALFFIAICYALYWIVSRFFLLVTCPIWIIPYAIFKNKRS